MMYFIPAPTKLEKKVGAFLFSSNIYLNVEPNCSGKVTRQAGLFNEEVEKLLGYRARLTRGCGQQGDIVIRQDDRMKKQSYILDIRKEGITLVGEECGLWYGLQTLRQILEQAGAVVPAMLIEDAPDIPNRGYYFDCARGRVPKLAWLKKLVDRMAYYKLNQLQLYIEHSYLFRGMTELWRDDTPLTAAEIMELDHYCLERGIELIPSLSCFGHLYKLLSSKEYAYLCELENSDKQPFSLAGRMHHHTINPINPESVALMKRMIGEYMELFSSRQFNICADETFDLGQGRSKDTVEKLGRDRVYINYVKELAQYLVDNGRKPMFWGDIILGFPEMIKELPEKMVCLNWGYGWNQGEDETKRMYEAGAVQYCCPGCSSWNQFVPLNWNSYQNVSRLCTYAVKYGAIGVLNTDWGDFLHVNNPDFSRVGMIYGAAFSWNVRIPLFGEINRQISRLEYHDSSERLLAIIAKVPKNVCFEWKAACGFREMKMGNEEFADHFLQMLKAQLPNQKETDEKNARLERIIAELYGQIRYLEKDRRGLIKAYINAVDGIRLFNQIGKIVAAKEFGYTFDSLSDPWKLAKSLESWLYDYKEIYRGVSKESELARIQELICWYGDYLRDVPFLHFQ